MCSKILNIIAGLTLFVCSSFHVPVIAFVARTDQTFDGFNHRRIHVGRIIHQTRKTSNQRLFSTVSEADKTNNNYTKNKKQKKKVAVIGAGWGGLSAAYTLSKNPQYEVTIIDAASQVGGLVQDGYTSMTGERKAEAGQHGFWDQYYNIFRLLKDDLDIFDKALTGYAEQGQYSPNGLEAVWPVYRDQSPSLPTGLAQAVYTKFNNLPLVDWITAFPLVLAFSEFDDSPEAWDRYDDVSFRDLCVKLGVSKRCYEEAFEPMILTGLFAPGAECSAAAALGMAYFFVLSNQKAFDVRWCKGNIGGQIFDPWVEKMKRQENPVNFLSSLRVTGFEVSNEGNSTMGGPVISSLKCMVGGEQRLSMDVDEVVFAVGASALNGMVRNSPDLAQFADFRRFANLRGTSVLATRVFLDRKIITPYTANACWGFDAGWG